MIDWFICPLCFLLFPLFVLCNLQTISERPPKKTTTNFFSLFSVSLICSLSSIVVNVGFSRGDSKAIFSEMQLFVFQFSSVIPSVVVWFLVQNHHGKDIIQSQLQKYFVLNLIHKLMILWASTNLFFLEKTVCLFLHNADIYGMSNLLCILVLFRNNNMTCLCSI